MALELPKNRLNVRSIQTQKRSIPLQEIIAVQGQDPLATGIDTASNVIGQALAKRAELRQQGKMLAKLEEISGAKSGSYTGLDPATARNLAELKIKLSGEEKPKPLQGTITKEGKTYQPFYSDKTGQVSYQELLGPKNAPPKGLQFAGMDQNGNPISYDPNTGLTSTADRKPFVGNILPKNVGTEEQRRQALVSGAKTSIDDIRSIVSANPSVLSELKAIQLTPGRVYSQLASPDAKRLYINVREAIANEIYLKTGATANEQELENAAVSYLAALNDNPQDFLGRMDLLERNVSPFNQRSGLTPLNPPPPKPTQILTGKKKVVADKLGL